MRMRMRRTVDVAATHDEFIIYWNKGEQNGRVVNESEPIRATDSCNDSLM
jgi:hypothetical protein